MPLASSSRARGSKADAPTEAEQTKFKPHPLPSSKLTSIKTVDPFSTKKKFKTKFGAVYEAGEVPCNVNHGSVKNKLHWKIPPENLQYNPLLIQCAEGLKETDFPFTFLSRTAFKEMLEAQGGPEKAEPLVGPILVHFRAALSDRDQGVVEAVMDALMQLSAAVGASLNEYISPILVQLTKRPALKVKATMVLEVLEENGGEMAYRIIKSKVPTYCSVSI